MYQRQPNTLLVMQISAEFPCRSVLLEGNYHAPYAETAVGSIGLASCSVALYHRLLTL
jgi:hypothetical protein